MTMPINDKSDEKLIAPCLDAAVAVAGKPDTGATSPMPARVKGMNDSPQELS